MVLTIMFLSIMGCVMFICSFTHSAVILFFLFFIFLFDCAGSSCCARSFSSCSEQGTTLIMAHGLGNALVLLQNTGSRCSGSVVAALRLICSVARGILVP